ncbi:MAG TPA: PH domain-containing protein, partial [Jatrophihabitans sp.]|nr:PH domain-containing protein [Jatrophihabitans sp.]
MFAVRPVFAVRPGLAAPSGDDPVAADAQWRRLSPRMLLIHPVREVGRAIPALVGVLFASSSSGHDWWTAAALAVVVLLSLLRWFTTRYQITPEQVQLRTGLFRRRSMTTPADRVRTVDVTAHALHRVLGLARVSIGTGISDRKREGLVLDGLTAEAAGRLRAELLHRARLSGALPASGAVPSAGAVPSSEPVSALPATLPQPGPVPQLGPVPQPASGWEPAEEPIAVLDRSWIRYAPFTLSGAATALAVLGFGWRLFDQTRMSGK